LRYRAGTGLKRRRHFNARQNNSSEYPSRFILLVRWSRLEDHIVGFRQSARYRGWKSLLHFFCDPFPEVEHFETIAEG
jgi:heme-degrading monooxygenase HmoA